jgi:hypothetical protein
MSLTAKIRGTNKILDAQDYNKEQHKALVLDKFTDTPCIHVAGHDRKTQYGYTSKVRSHFRSTYTGEFPSHIEFSDEYFKTGEKYSPGESEEHREGKRWIAKKVEELSKGFLSNEILEFEKLLKLPNGKYRICDVAFNFPCGELYVFECQLSAITPETLELRSEDYRSLGVSFDWLFGKNADTKDNIIWYYDYFGKYPYILNFERTIQDLETT